MIAFLKSMFQDERGATSHKRIIGSICAIVLCLGLILGKNPSEVLVNAVAGIAMACIAGTTLDKFSFKSLPKKDDQA